MPKYIVERNERNELISIKRDRTPGPPDSQYIEKRVVLEARNRKHALLTASKFFTMIDEAKKKESGSTVSQSTAVKTEGK